VKVRLADLASVNKSDTGNVCILSSLQPQNCARFFSGNSSELLNQFIYISLSNC